METDNKRQLYQNYSRIHKTRTWTQYTNISITQSRLRNNPSPTSGLFSNLNFVSQYATHIREAVRKSLRTYQSPLEHTIECINDVFSILYHIYPYTSHSNPSQTLIRKTYADSVRTSVKHQIPKTSLKE